MNNRYAPKVRKQLILVAALTVARRPGGFQNMTRAAIAKEAHCADGLVSKYLGSMDAVRRSILRAAVKYEYLDLIAQGIASGDRYALALDPILKHKAFSVLLTSGD